MYILPILQLFIEHSVLWKKLNDLYYYITYFDDSHSTSCIYITCGSLGINDVKNVVTKVDMT